ncbi:MAG: hypothetical protein A2014_05490 [Spirochaetes bacterium GWF1_49_6]|nr:MAG: hypothetical protein A2014_05490 [Spirochaetes bacterium GWF1_49_6]
MTQINEIVSIQDTTLWNKLNNFSEESAKTLARDLIAICKDVSSYMKLVIKDFPEYTLHDEVHLLKVTEIMALLLGETLDKLNFIEIGLLILSAFFHDTGMVITKERSDELESDSEYKIYRDTWLNNYQNYYEFKDIINDSKTSVIERINANNMILELDCEIRLNYIRKHHGKYSEKYIEKEYSNDKRLEIFNVNLKEYITLLCKSHTEPLDKIAVRNIYKLDDVIGSLKVNIQFIAIILRLSDILDFDRDRTPDILYKSIHFTNNVSITEWEKHRSVLGRIIDKKQIKFSIKCKHPVYQKSILHFMDRRVQGKSATV